MQALHDEFMRVKKIFHDSDDEKTRSECFEVQIDALEDACRQVLAYTSDQPNAAFFDGLVRFACAAGSTRALVAMLAKEGDFDCQIATTFYKHGEALKMWADGNKAIVDRDGVTAMDLEFAGFGNDFKHLEQFIGGLVTRMKQRTLQIVERIEKTMYDITPSPEDVAKEKILEDAPLHAALLDDSKRSRLPGLVVEAKNVVTMYSFCASCGLSLLQPAEMQRLKDARSHGRMCVGVAYIVDHLKNKYPEDPAKVPAFAKDLTSKLTAKKIPLPSFVNARLAKLAKSK